MISISSIFIVIVIAGAGWFAWRRWRDWRTPLATGPSAEQSQKTRAFEAFLQGNSCLAAGQFTDATAAFEQARTLDPKRPYVAERLAEVARQQHAASAPAPVTAGG
jgi:predicted negative regulator of RcsB-dependent stress response